MTKKTVPMGQIYFLLLFIVLVAFYIWMIWFTGLDIPSLKLLGVQDYGYWFILTSIISYIIIAIELYRNAVIDRVIWAGGLFFTIGSVVFLSNIPVSYTHLTLPTKRIV